MADKQISQGLKSALELGPVAIFFIAYLRMRDEVYTIAGTEYSGFIVVTALFVPLLLLSTLILWRLTGKISRMQIVTAVLVIFFGGLTVYFNDEKFFKIKTTIVYGSFAAILGAGLLLGKSWLAFVMEELMPLQPEGWMKLTRRLVGMFAALAAANEFVWRTMSTDTWVKIETFGFPIALFAFFMAQTGLLSTYALEQNDDDQS
ncbi:MAG: inner membrane-spanning protein YciB [Pseudomonadota bacterium]